MDIVYTLAIFGSLFFVAFILWCACALADEFDEVKEEQWLEYLERSEKDGSARISSQVQEESLQDCEQTE